MEFDEQQAIEFINNRLAEAGRKVYPDDEVFNVIDMIWDFYDENGLLELESNPADEPDDIEQDVVDYVVRMLKKDKAAAVDIEDVALMVRAEMDYEDSII